MWPWQEPIAKHKDLNVNSLLNFGLEESSCSSEHLHVQKVSTEVKSNKRARQKRRTHKAPKQSCPVGLYQWVWVLPFKCLCLCTLCTMRPFITHTELEQSIFAAPLPIYELVCTLCSVSHSVSERNRYHYTSLFLMEAAREKGQKEKPEFLLSGGKLR